MLAVRTDLKRNFKLKYNKQMTNFKGLEILVIQKVYAVITMFEENNMPKSAKMLRDNI